jgi:hypothetical protein
MRDGLLAQSRRLAFELRPIRSVIKEHRLARAELLEWRRWPRRLPGVAGPMPNAEHLRRKIAPHIQAEAEGGLPESARQPAFAVARAVDLRVRVCANVVPRKAGVPPDRTGTTAVAPAHDSRLPMPSRLLVKDFQHGTPLGQIRDDALRVSLFSIGVQLAPQCPVQSVDALDCSAPKSVHGVDMTQLPTTED